MSVGQEWVAYPAPELWREDDNESFEGMADASGDLAPDGSCGQYHEDEGDRGQDGEVDLDRP